MDRIETFVNLIPIGEENAISRKYLVTKCLQAGLIEVHQRDKDRAMRNILEKAKIDWAICNNGKGYFRPMKKDSASLYKAMKTAKNRMLTEYKGYKSMSKLYEDFRADRKEYQ